jgi:hypothetical protein
VDPNPRAYVFYTTPSGRQTTEEKENSVGTVFLIPLLNCWFYEAQLESDHLASVGAGVQVVRVQTSVAVGTRLFCVDGCLFTSQVSPDTVHPFPSPVV